jgi:hypothetical protein
MIGKPAAWPHTHSKQGRAFALPVGRLYVVTPQNATGRAI